MDAKLKLQDILHKISILDLDILSTITTCTKLGYKYKMTPHPPSKMSVGTMIFLSLAVGWQHVMADR
jgi:hypothetical protein